MYLWATVGLLTNPDVFLFFVNEKTKRSVWMDLGCSIQDKQS